MIHVTQGDIENAERHFCCRCPIALAIARTTGKRAWPSPFGVALEDAVGGIGKAFPLPNLAIQFMNDYDSMGAVAPFSFPLEITA